jgi:tetratricopeptide (TPR) repeat protein
MMPKAEAAARKALELNPQLPAAFFWLAVHAGETGDLKSALAICKQLLHAAPNSEYAYQAMGHAYDYAGLPDIALTLFRKAAEINPVTYPYMLGFIYFQKGDYAAARRELEACPDTVPEKVFWLSAMDAIEGKREEAIARLGSLSSKFSTGLFHAQTRALLHALLGEKEKGLALVDAALDSKLQLGSYHYYITAEILAQLGEPERALAMLRDAVKTGYGNHPFLLADPLLQPLREMEEFAAIAKAMQKLQSQLQLMLVTG